MNIARKTEEPKNRMNIQACNMMLRYNIMDYIHITTSPAGLPLAGRKGRELTLSAFTVPFLAAEKESSLKIKCMYNGSVF
jgi:hypothetical protein